MTLLERLNKELSIYELEFKTKKEYNDKFKGVLIGKQTGIEIPFEVNKALQHNAIKSHCKWVNDYVNLYIKLKQNG